MREKLKIIFCIILISILLIVLTNSTGNMINPSVNNLVNNYENDLLSVKINLSPMSTLYEGDIVKCNITGEPDLFYWTINNQSNHKTFFDHDPVLFDPEQTPINTDYVTLSVHAKKNDIHVVDSVKVKIKRIFFGDIHFHSRISDGYHKIDDLYQNAISDNYLDFVCLTDHAEIINSIDLTPPQP
jgi:hypothetical protein